MTRARATVLIAVAALVAVTASACAGVKSTSAASAAAAGHPPAAAEVRLVVTRDFGASVVLDTVASFKKGMTVMRLLAEHTTVDTGYGGQFVSGINGLRSTFGTVSSADAADWFYWVDGVMADVGADAWKLHGGDTVWWDYHRWAGAMFIPVALDAFPAPFAGHRLGLAASDPQGLGTPTLSWLRGAGLGAAAGQTSTVSPLGAHPPRGWAVVVATPAAAGRVPWLRSILALGPQSGVFVKLAGGGIVPLSASGAAGAPASGAALATPNPADPATMLLVVLADRPADLPALLAGLTPDRLAHRVAAYLPAGSQTVAPLPLPEGT